MLKINKIFIGLVVSSLVASSASAWSIGDKNPGDIDLGHPDQLSDRTVSTPVSTCTVKGFNRGIYPVSKSNASVSHCGTKSEKEALTDGTGVMVVGFKNETKINNSKFNKLALKYAEKASKEGLSLYDYVSYSENSEATTKEKLIVSKLKLSIVGN